MLGLHLERMFIQPVSRDNDEHLILFLILRCFKWQTNIFQPFPAKNVIYIMLAFSKLVELIVIKKENGSYISQ